jgi:hypothetical protein
VPRLRVKLRTLMIVVAILAVVIGGITVILSEINRSLYEYYGSGGHLEKQNRSLTNPAPPMKSRSDAGP